MHRLGILAAAAFALAPSALRAQEAGKWKPYRFAGNERFEYTLTTVEGEEKKAVGYVLDIRDKGGGDIDVTTSVKTPMKREQGIEILMGGATLAMAPAMTLLHPVFGAFMEQVDLKEGEKMSLLGLGRVKVTGKETVAGRTGFVCEMYTKQDEKDVLTWKVTLDPALGLPLRSILYEEGQEKSRAELVRYAKE